MVYSQDIQGVFQFKRKFLNEHRAHETKEIRIKIYLLYIDLYIIWI